MADLHTEAINEFKKQVKDNEAVLKDLKTFIRGTGNSQGRLRIKAVVLDAIYDESDDGNTYSWSSGTYDYTGLDTILLVKNTSNNRLDIQGIWLSTDTDTRVIIHLPITEVTVTGITVTGTNWNTGSAKTATADAARNETNNSQGNIIWSGEIYGNSGPIYINFLGSIILTKNKSIGIDYITTGTACDVTICGFFN